jgi:hypothetical protein
MVISNVMMNLVAGKHNVLAETSMSDRQEGSYTKFEA